MVGEAYGYLGVQLAPLSRTTPSVWESRRHAARWWPRCFPNSPAEQAGLKPRRCHHFLGWATGDDPTLLRLVVARSKVGSTVKVTVIRQGEEVPLDVTVGQRPQ